ncbi:MAG: hypothetical protein WCH85_05525 [Methanomicrobiales archaeon]
MYTTICHSVDWLPVLRGLRGSLLLGLSIVLIVFCQQAAAFSGTDTIIYSPNITLTEDSPEYTEFSIAFDLDGNHLVWMNIWAERKIENRQEKDTIYLMSLFDNETQVLSQTPGNHHTYPFHPILSLSHNSLVWPEFVKEDIFLYTLSTQVESQITTDGSVDNLEDERKNENPIIDDERVVWAKKKPYGTAGDFDIVMMNISTGIQRDICTWNADQNDPYISGSRIVWTDERNEPDGGDIYLFDLDTNQEMPVCTDSGSQKYPKIYNDTIIWRDYRDGGPAVYLYNLTSGAKLRISDPLFDAMEPFLSNNYVAWTEYSKLDPRDERQRRICVYNLAKGSREILPVSTKYPIILDLDGDCILYREPDNKPMKNGYLHLFVINDEMPTMVRGEISPAIAENNQTLPVVSVPETTVTHLSPLSVISLIIVLGCGILVFRKIRERR